MIDYLLLLALAKYRAALLPRIAERAPERDPLEDSLELGAGLISPPPQPRERPTLRIVK